MALSCTCHSDSSPGQCPIHGSGAVSSYLECGDVLLKHSSLEKLIRLALGSGHVVKSIKERKGNGKKTSCTPIGRRSGL